jgi:hypothetical protein
MAKKPKKASLALPYSSPETLLSYSPRQRELETHGMLLNVVPYHYQDLESFDNFLISSGSTTSFSNTFRARWLSGLLVRGQFSLKPIYSRSVDAGRRNRMLGIADCLGELPEGLYVMTVGGCFSPKSFAERKYLSSNGA